MTDILTSVRSARRTATPQTVKSRPDEVRNAAGGYVFSTGDAAQLHRFLTIGTAGGTFYTGERLLTKENAEVLVRELARDGIATVKHIVEVSKAGRAPKQDYGLFALAMATSPEFADEETRKLALASVVEVARTGSTLFQFLKYAEQFRGWGRGLRNAVSGWYDDRDIEWVAYQVFKYRQRHDRRHDDALRQAHPTGNDLDHALLYNYLAATSPTAGSRRKANGGAQGWNIQLDGRPQRGNLPALVDAFETVQNLGKADKWTKAATRETVLLIQGHNGLSWEMLPDAALGEREVWEALFEDGIPQTAVARWRLSWSTSSGSRRLGCTRSACWSHSAPTPRAAVWARRGRRSG
jgi:60 kDa SS-A/Ro ribonucleoprotein